MTARDIVTQAFRRLNIYSPEETLPAGDALYGLSVLNELIDQWRTEGLTSWELARTTYTVPVSTQTVTVGTGANLNVLRPVSPQAIDHINYIDTSLTTINEIPMIPLTNDAWAAVPIKLQSSAYATSYFYDPTYPTGTLYLWPVPNISTFQLVMYSMIGVVELATLSTLFAMPPGYRRFYISNLAVEIAPTYEKAQVPDTLLDAARQSKLAVKNSNFRLSDMQVDPGSLGNRGAYAPLYNVFSDTSGS